MMYAGLPKPCDTILRMRINSFHLALVCSFSAVFLLLGITSAVGNPSVTVDKRTVFVARFKIRKGERIRKNMIVREVISEKDPPQDAVELSRLIVGQRPNHDIPPTKIIQEADFLDLPGINVPFVYTTTEIPAGTPISRSDLKVIQSIYYSRVPAFPPRPTKISAVVGKKAKLDLPKNHELVNSDLTP